MRHLLENRGFQFTLCGSSGRKVKGGAANLLGGRAVRLYEFGERVEPPVR